MCSRAPLYELGWAEQACAHSELSNQMRNAQCSVLLGYTQAHFMSRMHMCRSHEVVFHTFPMA